jgi:hypothetical protein
MRATGNSDYVIRGARGLPGTIHLRSCRALAGKHVAGYSFGNGLRPAQLRDELARRGETREDTRFCRTCLAQVEPLPAYEQPHCAYQDCGRPRDDTVHVLEHAFRSQDTMPHAGGVVSSSATTVRAAVPPAAITRSRPS